MSEDVKKIKILFDKNISLLRNIVSTQNNDNCVKVMESIGSLEETFEEEFSLVFSSNVNDAYIEGIGENFEILIHNISTMLTTKNNPDFNLQIREILNNLSNCKEELFYNGITGKPKVSFIKKIFHKHSK